MPYKDPEKGREFARKSYAENPEKKREANRKYRTENPEKAHETARKSYAKNREKRLKANRKYRAENPEKAHETARKASAKYYAENREKARECARKYRAANPEQIREYNLKYRQQMTPYLYAMHDMILETAEQLPDDTARRQFAVEMLYEPLFADVAYRCDAVEEFIVTFTETFSCTSVCKTTIHLVASPAVESERSTRVH